MGKKYPSLFDDLPAPLALDVVAVQIDRCAILNIKDCVIRHKDIASESVGTTPCFVV